MPSNNEPNRSRFTVVGIGASAGGVDALRAFFAALPPDLGVAYVVVVHLAPDYESELARILGRSTRMSVVEVSDHQELELKANCVYVIAPGRKLVATATTVAAVSFDDERERRTAIDVFFRSLAATHGDGFAVVLSGGGSDGSLGARAIKEAGGMVLVQDPTEAAHEAMPRAAIAAQIADVIAPVGELAERLVQLVRHGRSSAPLIDEARGPTPETDEAVLRRILELVRARTGHDFTRYKRPTILRRVARRIQLNHRADLEQYLELLRENPDEIHALFDDLLITVTTFFRDPAAWDALRLNVVVPLVQSKQGDDSIRVWVPACATGEEAYSLAMLFREEIAQRNLACELVIFGSDVDQGALATARDGVYPAAIAADVSDARLARFFRSDGDHYRISNETRDSVVFAVHSVLRDPPFSKLDLISCRNLLIYLDRELQQQLQNVFRYGLSDDGYLFVGVSETVDSDLFEPVDKQNRIFRTRGRAVGVPVRLPQLPDMPLAPRSIERVRERGAVRARRSAGESHVETLEELAPPSVLVDEHWNIEHLSATAGRFLQPRGGPPTHTLTELVRPELADELRDALHRAFELQEPSLSAFVPVRFNGAARRVGVLVQPRPRQEDRVQDALVMFLDAGGADKTEAARRDDASDTDTVIALREKLRIADQRLDTMRQEHGLAYEDLRAMNEELQSLNEEYRSTTEELETSKEELHSVNEELQTVNNELKLKLEEAARANNDLENFMAATDFAMLFLDRNLCIKRHTAALRQVFNVKRQDHGRPIGDLTHNLAYDEFEKDAASVLVNLVPVERQVPSREGGSLTVRIRPYRTSEDRIDGVVVTFVR
jgi:two-component system CheB/CheR fusion protein